MERNITRMAEAMAADRESHPGRKKQYKQLSDEHKIELLSADILNTAEALKRVTKQNRICLDDTVKVQTAVDDYMQAAAVSGCFPTVIGLCSFALGCSRQNVNAWMKAHPHHRTTEYLETVFDGFASILLNAGLMNNAHPILTIFQLKNCHGFRDQIQLEPVQHEPMRDEFDPEEIKRRYLVAKNPLHPTTDE